MVSIDIELDSIEVNQCDFPETKAIQEAKEKWTKHLPLSLYGTHRCRRESTKVTRKFRKRCPRVSINHSLQRFIKIYFSLSIFYIKLKQKISKRVHNIISNSKKLPSKFYPLIQLIRDVRNKCLRHSIYK